MNITSLVEIRNQSIFMWLIERVFLRHSDIHVSASCSFGKSSRTLTITSHKADKITVSNNRRCISGTLPAFIKIEINQNVAHKLKNSLDIMFSVGLTPQIYVIFSQTNQVILDVCPNAIQSDTLQDLYHCSVDLIRTNAYHSFVLTPETPFTNTV